MAASSSSSLGVARLRRVPAAGRRGPRSSAGWRPACSGSSSASALLIVAAPRGAGVPERLARRQGRHARGRRRRRPGVAHAAARAPSGRPSGWRGSTGSRSSVRTPSTPAPRSSGWCSAWCRRWRPRSLASTTSCASGASRTPCSGTWPSRRPAWRRNSSSGVQVTLDYAFSALNIALATFLVVKVRGNRTANLLAIGMVGTAVAFNLQSHAALVVIGTQLGGFTQVWHDLGVHVLAGVAYVFALLLFPDGSIDRSRGPHLMGLAVFFGLVSFVAISDHTSALVLLFGVLVPAAALLAHSRRFREAQSPGAPPALPAARGRDGRVARRRGRRARRHVGAQVERRAVHRDHARLRARSRSTAGTYVFYCDPHTDDMEGTVIVTEPTSSDDGTRDRADRGARERVRQGPARARGGPDQRDPLHQHRRRPSTTSSIYRDEAHTRRRVRRRAVQRPGPGHVHVPGVPDRVRDHPDRPVRGDPAVPPVGRRPAREPGHGLRRPHRGARPPLRRRCPRRRPGARARSSTRASWSWCGSWRRRCSSARSAAGCRRRSTGGSTGRSSTPSARSRPSPSHVRDQVDLDELADELVTVVSDTMHPTQVSLWIRDGESAPRRDVDDGRSVVKSPVVALAARRRPRRRRDAAGGGRRPPRRSTSPRTTRCSSTCSSTPRRSRSRTSTSSRPPSTRCGRRASRSSCRSCRRASSSAC